MRGGIVDRLLKLLPWLATRSRNPSWTPILIQTLEGISSEDSSCIIPLT
jgi:hypothetical protein